MLIVRLITMIGLTAILLVFMVKLTVLFIYSHILFRLPLRNGLKDNEVYRL